MKKGNRMTTTTQREHNRPGPYRVLGTRPIRHDGLDKVTGVAKYGADIQLPGMLHGMILRSPPRVTTLCWTLSMSPAVAFCYTVTSDAGLPLYICPSQNWWQRLSRWVMVNP